MAHETTGKMVANILSSPVLSFVLLLAPRRRDCGGGLRAFQRYLADSGLDGPAERNGGGMCCQCSPLRTNALLPDGSFFLLMAVVTFLYGLHEFL
jgi:hypothetical protein